MCDIGSGSWTELPEGLHTGSHYIEWVGPDTLCVIGREGFSVLHLAYPSDLRSVEGVRLVPSKHHVH